MSSAISKLMETASAPPLLCLMFLLDSCGPLGHHSGNLRVEWRGLLARHPIRQSFSQQDSQPGSHLCRSCPCYFRTPAPELGSVC